MDKINVAIVGYGNIGQFAMQAVQSARDMQLAGIVRRGGTGEISGTVVVDDIKKLGKVDVALLCVPSTTVEVTAKKYLEMGISTVDSFDIHSVVPALHSCLDSVAKANNAVAIISAGWDPGTDSIVRAMMEACTPNGITYTNFGPGMSMGHTVAAKAICGVADALSMTIPLGTGIHRRIVYIKLQDGADQIKVCDAIKADPYFAKDETHVVIVDDVNKYLDKGHGVHLSRKGVSGTTHNQNLSFDMSINNPALTSQIMVSCARAATRQKSGAYTMIELPVIDLLQGERSEIIARLV